MCTVRKLIFRYYRRNADVSKPDVALRIEGVLLHLGFSDWAGAAVRARLQLSNFMLW